LERWIAGRHGDARRRYLERDPRLHAGHVRRPRLACRSGRGIGAGFVAGATTYATLCCLTVVAAVALLAFVPRRKSA